MELLKQIQLNVNQKNIEEDTLQQNFSLFVEGVNMTSTDVAEAVTHWLAKLRDVSQKGPIDASKKSNVAHILGALISLSDPDIASSFDVKGDLGTLLYAVSGEDKVASQAAFARLLQMGHHPSVRKYVDQVVMVIDKPEELKKLVNITQTKIDQVMRTLVAKERQKTPSPK